MKTEPTFTPGPWTYRSAFTNGEPCGFVVQSGVNPIVDINSEQDARLIAAAPDLLKALQDFDVWLISPDLSAHTLATMRDRARAAIARATKGKP